MNKIYLDVCCLSRPFDDQTQDRIRLESEAILLIIYHFESGDWQWVGSEALELEVHEAPDAIKKSRVELLMKYISQNVLIEVAEIERAEQLEKEGFTAFDALHLACAESGGADIFLTTDDRLVRLAARLSAKLHLRVENPLIWLKEVVE